MSKEPETPRVSSSMHERPSNRPPYVDRIWSDEKGAFIDRLETQVPAHLQEGVRILLLLEMRPATEAIQ